LDQFWYIRHMIIKVPMDKVVVAYVQAQLGLEPIKFNTKSHLCFLLFTQLRNRTKQDVNVAPGAHFLELVVPDLFLGQGKTYISYESIGGVEDAIKDLIKERITELVFNSKCKEGVKYKEAMLRAQHQIGVKDEIMSYETLKKRIQRLRVSLESRNI
jgi:hypothetical protein